jgi:hypothetical protein
MVWRRLHVLTHRGASLLILQRVKEKHSVRVLCVFKNVFTTRMFNFCKFTFVFSLSLFRSCSLSFSLSLSIRLAAYMTRVYVADTGNNCIRGFFVLFTFTMYSCIHSLFSSLFFSLSPSFSLHICSAANMTRVYVADTDNHCVRVIEVFGGIYASST